MREVLTIMRYDENRELTADAWGFCIDGYKTKGQIKQLAIRTLAHGGAGDGRYCILDSQGDAIMDIYFLKY